MERSRNDTAGPFEFIKNDVVIAIDFVMETRNRTELNVQFRILSAHAGRVNFQFQHGVIWEAAGMQK
jgi:hypothetical protein